MAVDQDLVDEITSSLVDLYREAESALIRAVAHRLLRDLDSPYQSVKLDAIAQLRRAAMAILAGVRATKADVIRQAVARAYFSGFGRALADLPEDWSPLSGIGQAARQAMQQVPNVVVIERIAVALHQDIGRVEANILRAALDAYRAVQAAVAARIGTGAFNRRQASQAAWQALMDKGITNFVDKSGRVWRLSSYVEMVGRTAFARAATQGQVDRLRGIDVNLVYVSNHSQECRLCRPFEGRVLAVSGPTGRLRLGHEVNDGQMVEVDVVATLDQARAAGLFHPNCRHSISAYLPGVTRLPERPTADPKGDEARQRQRYIERQIRKYKERAVGALSDDDRKAANAKVRDWQSRMRTHLKENPTLKRLSYREQVGAGNIPGPNGPAGGPVGDLQPATSGTTSSRP